MHCKIVNLHELIICSCCVFRNTTVDLSHIDTPVNMNAWPSFHNGVATGLRTSNKAQVVIHDLSSPMEPG